MGDLEGKDPRIQERFKLMVAFGAAFGYTVMARISLLIGRMGFLGRWIDSIF